MYRKEKILKVGAYDAKLRRRQDYDLWYRSSFNNLKFKNIEIPLIRYRVDITESKKKNNFSVQLQQYMIGIRGNNLNSLGIKSYIGVTANFLINIQPVIIKSALKKMLQKYDPRSRKSSQI